MRVGVATNVNSELLLGPLGASVELVLSISEEAIMALDVVACRLGVITFKRQLFVL